MMAFILSFYQIALVSDVPQQVFQHCTLREQLCVLHNINL